jgi:hypothetical protein
MILRFISGPGFGGQAPPETRAFFRNIGPSIPINSSRRFLLSLAKDGAGPIPVWNA